MAGPSFDWDEKTDSMALSTAGFNLEGGRAVMQHDVPVEALEEAIEALLGSTGLDPTDGRLVRVPPMAHPQFPWLVCNNIQNIQGLGEVEFVDGAADLEVPAIPTFGRYPQYRLTTEWGPRPYPILQDSSIGLFSDVWYDEDDVDQPIEYANEWERYTDIEVLPIDAYVEGRQGQMCFRPAEGQMPGTATGTRQGYGAAPRMYLPDSVVKIRWSQVPYRYISSPQSYLRLYKATVNQMTFNCQRFSWGPGELLYQGYATTRFTPALPDKDIWAPGLYSTEKLADIELTFLETKRKGQPSITPANRNWIAAGHNVLPWLPKRKFWYATACVDDKVKDADTTKWQPSFP